MNVCVCVSGSYHTQEAFKCITLSLPLTLSGWQSRQLLSASLGKLNEPYRAFLAHSQKCCLSSCRRVDWLGEQASTANTFGSKATLCIFMHVVNIPYIISRVNNQWHALIKCLSHPATHTYIFISSHVGIYERIYNCCGCCNMHSLSITLPPPSNHTQWVSGAVNQLLFDRSMIVRGTKLCKYSKR